MWKNPLSPALVGALLTAGLVAAVAVADQPDPSGQTIQSEVAVRNQVQTQESNRLGEPLAAAGQQSGQQSRRQLGRGDGGGSQTGESAAGKATGSSARARKGQGSDRTARPEAARGSTSSRSATAQRQRLRDPGTGCAGASAMNRSRAAGGQRRGGGRH